MGIDRSEREALYALYLSEGIGNLRAIALREYFGSAERVIAARKSELLAVNGFGAQTVESLLANREVLLGRARQDLEKLSSDTICISYFDEEYPASLKTIYSPPIFLFTRGNIELLRRERNVAVVGTRRMTTDYGQPTTKEIAGGLAQSGVCITSGFALGVDSCAHRAAFDAGGETIAVLGSGIDVIYPTSNKKFAEELVGSGRGLLISEFPVGTSPDAKNFPWRNRIVCGLARACIVIESDEKGGSMITAEIAQDQGRVLYAIPGDIFRSTSKGTNKLLVSRKAYPIRNAEDVLKDLGWGNNAINLGKSINKERNSLTLEEAAIVDILDSAGVAIHIDTIAERAEIGVQDLLVRLLDLEFRDIVRQLPGKYFSTIF